MNFNCCLLSGVVDARVRQDRRQLRPSGGDLTGLICSMVGQCSRCPAGFLSICQSL